MMGPIIGQIGAMVASSKRGARNTGEKQVAWHGDGPNRRGRRRRRSELFLQGGCSWGGYAAVGARQRELEAEARRAKYRWEAGGAPWRRAESTRPPAAKRAVFAGRMQVGADTAVGARRDLFEFVNVRLLLPSDSIYVLVCDQFK
jgi:hypothetical protein